MSAHQSAHEALDSGLDRLRELWDGLSIDAKIIILAVAEQGTIPTVLATSED